jgi:SAM-dependent methyltransferase
MEVLTSGGSPITSAGNEPARATGHERVLQLLRRRLRAGVREGALGAFRILNRGDRHQCPCCGRTFARFIRQGRAFMCPSCRSLERSRVLMMYLENETDVLDAGGRVLHLAPEPSIYPRFRRKPKLIYTTGDLQPGPHIDVQLDARDLPFEDASFDLVICSHVLEHIVEDTQVAREFRRVLSPTGQALIMIPVDHTRATTYESPEVKTPAERSAVYRQHNHVRIYGSDAIDRLRAGGFTVERIPYADRLAPELQWRFLLRSRGQQRGEDIYRCTPR